MTMTNAEWMIKQGYKFRELDWICSKTVTYDYDILLNNKCIGKVKDSYSNKAIATWLDMEHKEPILDDAERRYLKDVIRPFRNKVNAIRKVNNVFVSEYIIIDLESESVCLPDFPAGTMYKGMEVSRHYTLKELGL